MNTSIQEKNRTKILEAAEKVLQDIGRDELSIRKVADKAGVQAPTIYRIFEDKQGLLNSLAEQGFKRYMATELPSSSKSLVDDLRIGWDFHVKFGAKNPDLYEIMYGDVYAGQFTPAARIAHKGFTDLLLKLDDADLLCVSKKEAMFVAFSTASGAVRSILSLPDFSEVETYSQNLRETMVQSIIKK